MTKYCPRCKHTKPLSEFGDSRSSKDKHSYNCLDCQRYMAQRNWMNGFYLQVWAKYKNRCALCDCGGYLEVHHLYGRDVERSVDDFVLVCHDCHRDKMHGGDWHTKVKDNCDKAPQVKFRKKSSRGVSIAPSTFVEGV